MYKQIPTSLKYLITITSLACILSGCVSAGIQSKSGEKVDDVYSVFSSGEARLTCSVSCSGASGSSRGKQRGFYFNSLWLDLALEVARVGFSSDQSYFYLGRAAEGLGYREAAITYYKLALLADFKCGGWINVCDGLDFPSDINARLEPLNLQVAKEAAEKSAYEATVRSAKEAEASEVAKEAEEAEASKVAKEASEKLEREALAAKLASESAERPITEIEERSTNRVTKKTTREAARSPARELDKKLLREASEESTIGKVKKGSVPEVAEPTQKQAPVKVRSVMDL